MEYKKIVWMVLILLLLFPVSTASKDPVLPDVEIINPLDGQEVGGIVGVKVEATGYKLQNPYLTIKGDGMGMSFQMKDCIFMSPTTPNANSAEYMSCKYGWDTTSYQGEKVELTADIKDINGSDRDSVVVRVSGHIKNNGKQHQKR